MPVADTATIHPPMIAPGMLSRRLADRKLYQRRRDFFWSLYNRLLLRSIGRFLPGAGEIKTVRMCGVDGPLLLRLRSTDFLVAEELLRDGEYDVVQPDTVGDVRSIVDLGANIGLSVRLWQQRFPEARILAVEADQANAQLCRRNVQLAANAERVTVVQACVAGTERAVVIDRAGGEWGLAIRDTGSNQDDSGQASTTIMTRRLEEILDSCGVSEPIDLLKCDIEGAEQDLFAHCGGWISRVRNLIIELHDPYDQAMLLADLRRAGAERFTCRELFGGKKPLLFVQFATSAGGTVDLVTA